MLIYFGKEDFICNYYGGLDWVSKLEWSGQDDYNQQNQTEWTVLGTNAGSYVTQGPLTLLEVNNAGHMVPMDQPENALSMLLEFVKKAFDATEIERLIEERNAARKAKDFARADQIRDELQGRGIVLKDGAGGTTWSVQ